MPLPNGKHKELPYQIMGAIEQRVTKSTMMIDIKHVVKLREWDIEEATQLILSRKLMVKGPR